MLSEMRQLKGLRKIRVEGEMQIAGECGPPGGFLISEQ